MFLADYHMHSTLSPDAHDTMLDMARAAAEKGITELCFTNHIEDCSACPYPDNLFPPFQHWEEQEQEFLAARETMTGRIGMALGIELDNAQHDPELARKLLSEHRLDFVIGSVHSVRDHMDFYYLQYDDDKKNRELFELYLAEHLEMARLGLFDVVGHLGYVGRYMAKQGKFIDLMEYEPVLRELFNILISAGKGIEINTSSLFGALGKPIPDAPVLSLYKACGGEIITVGSDSHSVRAAGKGVREMYDLLRSLGFKYVAKFRDRKPEFIKI